MSDIMWEFFAYHFGPYNLAGQVMYSILGAILSRLITWIYKGPIQSNQPEDSYLNNCSNSFFLCILFLTSLAYPSGPYAKEPQLKGQIDWLKT